VFYLIYKSVSFLTGHGSIVAAKYGSIVAECWYFNICCYLFSEGNV